MREKLPQNTLEAYLDDLKTRRSISAGSSTPKMTKHDIDIIERHYFPCPLDHGEYVTLQICQDCEMSQKCDIYATMLDEDFE